MNYKFDKESVREFRNFMKRYCSYGNVLITVTPEAVKLKAFGRTKIGDTSSDVEYEISTPLMENPRKSYKLYLSSDNYLIQLFLKGDVTNITLYKDTYNDIKRGHPEAVMQEMVIFDRKGYSHYWFQRTANHATNSLDAEDIGRDYIEY